MLTFLPQGVTHFFRHFALWPLLLIAHFLASSLLAWHLLAQVNFGFPLGYQLLDIGQHIEQFGPQNRYKSGFAETDQAEHQRLFAEIAHGIQNGGEGLETIDYTGPNGESITLMRPPEVLHLRDVARLVTLFYSVGLTAGILFVVLAGYATGCRIAPPHARKALWITALGLISGATVLWALGPKRVFYLLHEWIFPPDHPWFFYYQDSLMTTLMKAPDLFGFIGALLLALTLVIWGITLALFWRRLNHRARIRT